MALERTTCSRCGGSGEYSFNMKDGSRCYGCNGKGTKLTKRGAVAMQHLVHSMEVSFEQVQLGDKVGIKVMGGIWWVTVNELESSSDTYTIGGLRLNGEQYAHTGRGSDARFKRVLVEGERAQLIEAAEQFQATLTKQGKPRK